MAPWDPSANLNPADTLVAYQQAATAVFTNIGQGVKYLASQSLAEVGRAIFHQVTKAAACVFSGLLSVTGIDANELWDYVEKVGTIAGAVFRKPGQVFETLLAGVGAGFVRFGRNFFEDAKEAGIKWLFGRAVPAGVTLPQSADVASLMRFFFEVVGLTWANIRQQLVMRVGQPAVQAAEQTLGIIKTVIELGPLNGITKLIDEAKQQIQDFFSPDSLYMEIFGRAKTLLVTTDVSEQMADFPPEIPKHGMVETFGKVSSRLGTSLML